MSGLLGRQGGGGGDAEAEGTEGHWEEKSDSGHVDCAVLELTLSLSLSLTPLRRLSNSWRMNGQSWSLQAGRASRDTAGRTVGLTPRLTASHRYQYWGQGGRGQGAGGSLKLNPPPPPPTTPTRQRNYLKHKSVARFHTGQPARHFLMIRVNFLL